MAPQSKDPAFPSTHWSVVQRLGGGDEGDSRRAMEDICRRYWYPIYAFVRRNGYTPLDAEDLTQGFFQRLIGGNALLAARAERGRLRSYFLGMLKRMLSDHERHHAALKRGGGVVEISFDEVVAEDRYRDEPADSDSPDKLFDRAWATGILKSATALLEQAFIEGDNAEAFLHLREFLPQGDNSESYRAVAERMGVQESAVRLMVHRMRQRYRKFIADEVAQTVADPADVGAEIEHLLAAVGS